MPKKATKKTAQKPQYKMLVTLEGGCLSCISTNVENLDLRVLDWDSAECGDMSEEEADGLVAWADENNLEDVY